MGGLTPLFIKLNNNYYNIRFIMKIEQAPVIGIEITMCDGEMVRTDEYQNASSLVRKIDRLAIHGSSDVKT